MWTIGWLVRSAVPDRSDGGGATLPPGGDGRGLPADSRSVERRELAAETLSQIHDQSAPATDRDGQETSLSRISRYGQDQTREHGIPGDARSLVETEFWNMDALFMPQFHPARDIHDVYFVKEPTHATAIDEPFLSRVTKVHENGGADRFNRLGLSASMSSGRNGWSCGARGRRSRPERLRHRRQSRESIFPSPAVSDTIKSMRPTRPIFSRWKGSCSAKTSTFARCWAC